MRSPSSAARSAVLLLAFLSASCATHEPGPGPASGLHEDSPFDFEWTEWRAPGIELEPKQDIVAYSLILARAYPAQSRGIVAWRNGRILVFNHSDGQIIRDCINAAAVAATLRLLKDHGFGSSSTFDKDFHGGNLVISAVIDGRSVRTECAGFLALRDQHEIEDAELRAKVEQFMQWRAALGTLVDACD